MFVALLQAVIAGSLPVRLTGCGQVLNKRNRKKITSLDNYDRRNINFINGGGEHRLPFNNSVRFRGTAFILRNIEGRFELQSVSYHL